jgi:Protein of unknown function (DUF1580)
VAIDLNAETTLSLSQAARLLPPGRRGRPVTLSCVLRWVLTGTKAPSGEVIRLEALRLGGRWVTSREALQRFAERLTPRVGTKPAPSPRSPAQRRRAGERAARELENLGI